MLMTTQRSGMTDVIIIGQGLVGSLLAIACQWAGLNALVIDNAHKDSSTKIAAGIMNPLIGPRLTPIWGSNSGRYSEVINFYRSVENFINVKFLSQHRLVRFLNSDCELNAYYQRLKDPMVLPWINPTQDWGNSFNIGKVQFESSSVARVNTRLFLDGIKTYLMNNGMLIQSNVDYKDIKQTVKGIEWQGNIAKTMVFCEGARGSKNPFFPELTFRNAKSHMIELKMQSTAKSNVIQSWVLVMPSKEWTLHVWCQHILA